MTARQPRSPTSKPDVANLGLVRPPFVYLVALVIGVGLHLVRPARWVPAVLGAWVGVPIMIAALALFFSSIRRFKAAGTPVPGNKPATAIVNQALIGSVAIRSISRFRRLRAQQLLVARHARGRRECHVVRRHSEGGALPRAPVWRRVSGLQSQGGTLVLVTAEIGGQSSSQSASGCGFSHGSFGRHAAHVRS